MFLNCSEHDVDLPASDSEKTGIEGNDGKDRTSGQSEEKEQPEPEEL